MMRGYRRPLSDFHGSTIATFSIELSCIIDTESPRYFHYIGFIRIAERCREKIQRVISCSTPAHYAICASIYHSSRRARPRIFTL